MRIGISYATKAYMLERVLTLCLVSTRLVYKQPAILCYFRLLHAIMKYDDHIPDRQPPSHFR